MLRSSVCEGKRSECRKDYNRDLYCVKVRRVSSQKKDFATESSYGCMSFSIPAPPRPAPIHKKPWKRKKVENNYCKSNNPLHTYPIAVLVQLFYITIVV